MIDRVAASIGGRSPDLVIVDSAVNASWGTIGVRRRRVLTIGGPLWAAASRPQQIALLGHEIAHEVNGDVTHGLIVGSALGTLTAWRRLLIEGGRQVRPLQRRSRIRDELARLVLVVLGAIPLLIQRLVEGARDRTTQRAEYLADELAARVGGTMAAAGMMELLLLEASIRLTLQRAANERVADRVGYLRDHVSHIPESELERLRRVAERRGHRVDATHPPTHLRVAFLRSLQRADPSVNMTLEEAAAVDAEVLQRQ